MESVADMSRKMNKGPSNLRVFWNAFLKPCIKPVVTGVAVIALWSPGAVIYWLSGPQPFVPVDALGFGVLSIWVLYGSVACAWLVKDRWAEVKAEMNRGL